MDYQCHSPRDAGGTLHLSPTHLHHVDSFGNLRRSISRSPSKNMYNPNTTKPQTPSPKSPFSPAIFTSPFLKAPQPNLGFTTQPEAELPVLTSTKRSRPGLRRTAPLKLISGSRTSSQSPIRRALSDSSDQGNASPASNDGAVDGQENGSSGSVSPMKWFDTEPKEFALFDTTSANVLPCVPFKARNHRNNFRAGLTVKSSPLKRSDGVMNLDQASSGSPSAKRRSIHIGYHSSPFVPQVPHHSSESSESEQDDVQDSFFRRQETDVPAMALTPRIPSTRTQNQTRKFEHSHLDVRPPRSVDFALDRPRLPRMSATGKQRSSLDSPRPQNRHGNPSPRRSLSQEPNRNSMFEDALQLGRDRQQPHPLSQALSPSSSTSSITGESLGTTESQFRNGSSPVISFAKSLPIGALRPSANDAFPKTGVSRLASNGPDFGTPETYKMARPDPAAFRSTGLISKRYRNPDEMPPPPSAHPRMPDTPCKSLPLDEIDPSSPTPVNSAIKTKFSQPQFGTPFKGDAGSARPTPRPLEKSASIFERSLQGGKLIRHDSFVSVDDDDIIPSVNGQGDSQSSNDELPPTPTKSIGHFSFVKPNSLRSSLFGRTSIGVNTFIPPSNLDIGPDVLQICKSSPLRHETKTDSDNAERLGSRDVPMISICDSPRVPTSSFAKARTQRQSHAKGTPSPLPKKSLKLSLFSPSRTFNTKSGFVSSATDAWSLATNVPRTPAESTLPDPSGLSISPSAKLPHSPIFNPNSSGNWGHPPETPTAQKDDIQHFGFDRRIVTPSNHAVVQDVDPCLISRFKKVEWYGRGEFSEVYRVFQSAEYSSSQNYFSPGLGSKSTLTPLPDRVWIVKKIKAPYHSSKIRERKFKEVQIMKQLGKSDHVVHLVDSWEANQHLYLQTEFCEEGNLHEFLARTGHKGRLDDFRIWKVLIELSLGIKHIHDSGFIHLDLKPANVFIDFEGVLKIGDFGLASEWPAPPHAEGDGDRRYIGPDILQGYFDKPADIFALGMIMFEIAGNCVLPDNGASWHQLRSGDWSNLPSLTSGSTNSIVEDSQNDLSFSRSLENLPGTRSYESLYHFGRPRRGSTAYNATWNSPEELTQPPNFMLDPEDDEALDQVVKWMMLPNPKERPVIDQVLEVGGVQWVNDRRRAGAVVFEGNWGPAPYECKFEQEDADSEMLDAP